MSDTRPPLTQPKDYPVPLNSAADHSSASQSNIWNINSPLPWIAVAVAASFLALGFAINSQRAADNRALASEALAQTAIAKAEAAQNKADIAEREARMQQYYLIEVDGKLIRLGINPPDGGYQQFRDKRISK